MRYGLEDRPPLGRSLLYAFQWLLIVVPFIAVTAGLLGTFLGADASAGASLVQRFCLLTGVVTVAQVLWGHRYPLLDGPSAALLLSAGVAAREGAGALAGGCIAGGALLLLLGAMGWVGRVRRVLTDRVVGVVLILISTTLLPLVYPMVLGVGPQAPHGRLSSLAVSHLVMAAIVLISHWGRGVVRHLSLFLGIAIGHAVSLALGAVDLAGLSTAPLMAAPSPLLGPSPAFTTSAVLSFTLAGLAVMANGLGSYVAAEEVVGGEGFEGRVERGICLTGVGGLLAGGMGVVGTVSYSLSPGVILVTGVGSRYPVLLAGLLTAALAFLPMAAALLASVPSFVVGGALLVSLAAQMGVGVNVLTRGGRRLGVEDGVVVGLPILLGTMAAMLPRGALDLFPVVLRSVLGNGLIVGMAAVLALELGISRTGRGGEGARGREDPRWETEDEDGDGD